MLFFETQCIMSCVTGISDHFLLFTLQGAAKESNPLKLVAWRSGNAFHPISEVSDRRSYSMPGLVSTAMSDCLRAGKSSWYVTSRLGQLSLPFLQGR